MHRIFATVFTLVALVSVGLARVTENLPPFTYQAAVIPRGIEMLPHEVLMTTAFGEQTFPQYYLEDLGSSPGVPAISLSTVNIFGVRTNGGTPTLTLYGDDHDDSRVIEFQLGPRFRLKVTGLTGEGVWEAASGVTDYSKDEYRWFTLERSPNYLALYDTSNQEHPLLDYRNDDEGVDLRQFARFSVRSPDHDTLWDFQGYQLPTDSALTPTHLNPYVKTGLDDVLEHYIRVMRERWRCINSKNNYRLGSYAKERCDRHTMHHQRHMAWKLRALLLAHGYELPGPYQYNNSAEVFTGEVIKAENGFDTYKPINQYVVN